jgi:hypothetical protein
MLDYIKLLKNLGRRDAHCMHEFHCSVVKSLGFLWTDHPAVFPAFRIGLVFSSIASNIPGVCGHERAPLMPIAQ